MISNIPIYRAKKIDSDEYVEGNLVEDEGVFYIIKNPVITHFYGLQQLTGEYEYLHKIDPTTLSIHFPGMMDSQRNKIFASLQEDGRGGDIFEHKRKYSEHDYKWTIVWDKHRFTPFGVRKYWNPNRVPLRDLLMPNKSKLIGIQE